MDDIQRKPHRYRYGQRRAIEDRCREAPTVPAARWPALRRLVRVRRLLDKVAYALEVVARFLVLWLALVGFCYLLGATAPARTGLYLALGGLFAAAMVRMIGGGRDA